MACKLAGASRPLALRRFQQWQGLTMTYLCACVREQDTLQTEQLCHWAESCARKASELVKAAGHLSEAIETVVGVLLAASHGWPRWAHAEVCSEHGRPPTQQLALVDALSRRLSFSAMLDSGPVRYEYQFTMYGWSCDSYQAHAFCAPRQWLAQEILCSAQTRSLDEQLSARLQQLVLKTIISDCGEATTGSRERKSIFEVAALRYGLQRASVCLQLISNGFIICLVTLCSLWKAAIPAAAAEPYLLALQVLLQAVAGASHPSTVASAQFFEEHVLAAAEDDLNDRPVLAAVRAVTPAFRQPTP